MDLAEIVRKAFFEDDLSSEPRISKSTLKFSEPQYKEIAGALFEIQEYFKVSKTIPREECEVRMFQDFYVSRCYEIKEIKEI